MFNLDKIAILGTGLLGGSIGLGLRAKGYNGRIIGLGRRQETIDTAVSRGCIDEGTLDISQALAGAKLAIMATPIGQFPELLKNIARYGEDGLIVTDVGSTKTFVCEQAKKILGGKAVAGRKIHFVGSHPMAGTEQHGPQAASADLFTGKPCIVTIEKGANTQAKKTVESLWKTLGMKMLHMTAQEHDKVVARVSHLPHILATILIEMAVKSDGLKVASSGFRDTTRIASGPPEIWMDILITNKKALTSGIDETICNLTALKIMLSENCNFQIMEFLKNAKSDRDEWLKNFEENEVE